jgi:hypothetical protein
VSCRLTLSSRSGRGVARLLDASGAAAHALQHARVRSVAGVRAGGGRVQQPRRPASVPPTARPASELTVVPPRTRDPCPRRPRLPALAARSRADWQHLGWVPAVL